MEWIKHDGKGLPKNVAKNDKVFVEFRDGLGRTWKPELAVFWLPDDSDPHNYWLADGSYNDIVLYRVSDPKGETK